MTNRPARPSRAFYAVALIWLLVSAVTLVLALDNDTSAAGATGLIAAIGAFCLAYWSRGFSSNSRS